MKQKKTETTNFFQYFIFHFNKYINIKCKIVIIDVVVNDYTIGRNIQTAGDGFGFMSTIPKKIS